MRKPIRGRVGREKFILSYLIRRDVLKVEVVEISRTSCERICTGMKLRGCAKKVRVLLHKDGDGERVWGKVRLEAVEEVSIATVGFYWDFQVFLFLLQRRFSEREKGEKNERSTAIVLCP